MKLLILAGGYGTRLYPIIKDTPKALLEVCGRPLIDHIIDKFATIKDLEEVCVVSNEKFVQVLQSWAVAKNVISCPIRVISDGTRTPEERLGAIGDILFVLERESGPSDWVVAGSDNLFDQDVTDFVDTARHRMPDVSVGFYDIRDLQAASKYGVAALDTDGRVVSLEEKPAAPRSTLISMCLYYFPRQRLSLIRRYVDETRSTDTTGGFIQWLYQKSPVYGFKFQGKWYDIGSFESYDDAQKNFLTSL